MIIDLHTHTSTGSYDSSISPAELISRSRQAGLDGICLTEHDRFWDQEQVEKLAQEHDFRVFGGAEVDTDEGHVLVFGIKEYQIGMHRVARIREIADRVGGFLVLSHPYRRWFYYGNDTDGTVERVFGNPVFDMVDTVESMNGRGMERQNKFSIDLADRLGRYGTGGSDAHASGEIGTCATEFENEVNTIEELVVELKAGRYRPVDLRRKVW